MLFKTRLHVLAVSATALFGTLAIAAPASAATYGNNTYTYSFAQPGNASDNGNGLSCRPLMQQAPAAQPAPRANPTPAPSGSKQAAPQQGAPQQGDPQQGAPQQAAPQQGAPAANPAAEPQANPNASAGLTAEEQQMLDLVNQERNKAGIAPLNADPELTKLARLKSQDMIDGNYFSHQSPTHGSPFDMMKKAGVTYRTAGENIAGNQSVSAAHTALMNSAGHRANILKGDFTHVGIGIAHGGQYGMMFTQQFVGR